MDKFQKSWNGAERASIQACLEKMLASPIFAHAERQQRFLRYAVAHTLVGNDDRLKGYTIGVEVFDREQDFDPAVDAIVRVEAARLRAKLREYYESDGRFDAVRLSLPKGSYAVSISFEPPSKREMRTAAASDVRNTGPTAVELIEDRPSVAVLPFANLSPDPAHAYFADGITEDLTTDISRVSALFVISRHSTFAYKDTVKRAQDIATELGVRYLVEGSVQRAGNRARINVQLIDAATGAQVWAERYDRDLKDIFAVQDEITRCVAAVLQVKLTRDDDRVVGREGTASVEAYDCVLRGLERFWIYSRESAEEARAFFAKAVVLDPGYAEARAWLARVLTFKWIMLWDQDPDALEYAFEHARTAVDLDPRLPFAYSVLCWVQMWRKQLEASVAAGWKAVAMDPNNADAHVFLCYALSAGGRGEEALHNIEKAMRLNPHPSALYQLVLGICYFVLEEYDKALAAFKRGVELREAFIPNHYFLCLTYMLLDRPVEVRAERETVLALTGDRKPVLQTIWIDEDLALRFRGLEQLAGL